MYNTKYKMYLANTSRGNVCTVLVCAQEHSMLSIVKS
jgi:hypothetical protein